MNKTIIVALSIFLTPFAISATESTKEGWVEYAGAQKNIFATGKAEQTISVAKMIESADSFGVGAIANLDGEITVFQGKPYITQVRGKSYIVDHGHDYGAVFAVWTRQSKWREEPISTEVKNYLDLQQFVKTRATAAQIEVNKPFPFRLTGVPIEVKWHINVDLTEGKPITRELFTKSKAMYVAKNQPMDIIGFYSEHHPGIFISTQAPAIKSDSKVKNAIHIHLVSHDGKLAGHIDDLMLSSSMKLLLPQN